MTREEAARAAKLIEALAALPDAEVAIAKRGPLEGFDERAFNCRVVDINSGEWERREGAFEIDLETAEKLIPLLRRLIESELEGLGVVLDALPPPRLIGTGEGDDAQVTT
jgi:hypothetical protein